MRDEHEVGAKGLCLIPACFQLENDGVSRSRATPRLLSTQLWCGAKLDVPCQLLHHKFSLHLPMSHATELAATELELSRLISIELKRRRGFGLELNATVFH